MQKKTPKFKKKGIGNIVIKILIAIIIVLIAIFIAYNSSIFNIKKINIKNNKLLLKEDILKESKIKKNINIFKLKLDDVEDNLLKNPFIKSASVKREIPATINLDIVERNRLFLFEYMNMYLVADEDGYIMEYLELQDEKMAIIKGFNTKSTELGDSVFKIKENKNLEELVKEAKQLKILSEIKEIDKDFSNDINIILKSGITVAFGTLDNVKYKLSILKQIMEDISKKDIKSGRIIMNQGSHPRLIIDD